MIKLTILHTNDIHGHVPELVRIAFLVREIRQEVEAANGNCLFVDAGDSEDTTLLESSLTKGSAMEAILRGAGCDYAALGNAIPVRYGQQAVENLAKHFGRPLLCANMKDENGNLVKGLEPFALTTFKSFPVGIIGLTAPIEAYTTFFKLQMAQPVDILPDLISEVKALGAKTVILLSHLGSEADKEVAEKIQGINIIIGAHDHKELNPPLVVKDTIIAQAGDFGRLLGRLDLKIDPINGKVIQHRSTLLPITEEIPDDVETQKVVRAEQVRARSIMNREVGILQDALESYDDRECDVGNLLADALLDRMSGAQISLVLGHWENGLSAGPLTQGMLFSANRSTANPGKTELTGDQILQFLRAALKPESAAKTMRALRGRAIGLPHIAGGRVQYSENLEKIEVEIQGKPLDIHQKYVVASTDMEFSDYVNYLVVPFEQMEFEVPTIMPEVLEAYIVKHTPVHKPRNGRITIKAD